MVVHMSETLSGTSRNTRISAADRIYGSHRQRIEGTQRVGQVCFGSVRADRQNRQKREILGQRPLRDAVPDVEWISVSFQMLESNHYAIIKLT